MKVLRLFATALLAIAIDTAYSQLEGGFLCLPPKIITPCPVKCKATCANPTPSGPQCQDNLDECGQTLDCVCPSHMVQISDSDNTCVVPADCDTTNPDLCAGVSCPGDKTCVEGNCVCPEGTNEHDGDACVTCPGRKVYQRCGHDCPINCDEREPRPCTRECRVDNYCICPLGYIERSNGDRSCVLPSECPVVEPCGGRCRDPFICVDDQCVCPEGSHLHMENCVTCPVGQIFQPCSSNCPANCDDRRPICTEECRPENYCTCPSGFIERSASDQTCIRPSQCPVIDPCADIRCTSPFICDGGECVCPEGSHLHNGDCVTCPGIKRFQPCAPNCPRNCDQPTGNMRCPKICRLDNFCVCPDGYIETSESDRTCIRPSQCPVDPCADVSCSGPQFCVEGKCVCPEGTHDHNGDCVTCPGMKIFVSCGSPCPENCEERGPRPCPAICDFDNHCACPEGYIEASKTDKRCIKPSECRTDPCAAVTCINPFICVEGTCVCPEGTRPHQGKCVAIDPCASVRCGSSFICVEGKCVCPEDTIPHHGKCVARCKYPEVYTSCASMCEPTCESYLGIDAPRICPAACDPDVHCVCTKNWVRSSKDDDRCIPEQYCKNLCAFKTCPPMSICMNGECRCLFPCPPNSKCVEGKCECNYGYSKDDYGMCKAGNPCYQMDCGPNGVCVEDLPGFGRCKCKDGYSKDIFGDCESDDPCDAIDCGPHGYCVEKPRGFATCECSDGYIPDITGGCIDRCAVTFCGANTDCKKGMCHCKPGYERSEYGPNCIKKYTDKCATVTCWQSNTVCRDGKCLCLGGYRKVRGVCRRIGSCYTKRCPRNEICKRDYLGMGECKCKPGYDRVLKTCIRTYYE